MKLGQALVCRILATTLAVATVVGCGLTDQAAPRAEGVVPSATPIASPTVSRASAASAVVCATATPVPLSSMVEGMKSEFRMESVPDPVLPAIVETSVSPDGICIAITFSDQDGHSVLIVRRQDGRYSRLSSASFLPWRPFSSMEWLSEEVLSFEVWSQPHYGWRYTVNVASEQLVGAVPVHD